MAVYQEKARDRIKRGLKRMSNIVEKGREEDFKEADTRKIVSDILCEYLGWDRFDNVTAEQMIGSRFADYVVKTSDEEVFVVEVKQIGLKLKETHLNQARQYAVDEGIDWIILTNGDDWQVYRTKLEGKVPVTKLVFRVTISDKTILPAQKTELFYLLSEEAHRKNEIEDYYQRRIALSGENLADHILSNEVINKLRIAIKATTGQNLKNSEIAEALVARLFIPEKVTEDSQKAILKMKKDEKKKSVSPKKKQPIESKLSKRVINIIQTPHGFRINLHSMRCLLFSMILGVFKCSLEVFEKFSRNLLLISMVELLHEDIAYSSNK